MIKKRRDTLLIPYAYGINTPNTPLKYGIDTVSIHKRLETRDKETSDGIRATAQLPQGVFAFEDGQGSKPAFKRQRSRKPKASKVDFSSGLHVFTDGACDPNPGPGGWAFVVTENGATIHSESGSDATATNNRMEMQAVISALRWMQANHYSKAQVHTDSQYCVKGANEWRQGWARKNWMRGENLIPNADLWQQMSAILDAVLVSLNWVPGHFGIAGNEAADRLACDALKRGLRERRAA
ncbi:ribonuclease H [Agrobacterium tumefaciens]|uniref:ribonuclease H family protein n=1 Tax=Agrobacterium tumefaciens TaxID=358 RepID=UPI0015721E6E|nr:ribonuclease H [Agrobacterium tumefaciens]NSZ61887.1 ribonuclease HI [Agrobacterium tumefaciens]NTA68259.1 ribonuclease HI [Agrobacterium tumefaciens]WIE38099.1 ribonuclease H [Agrobacterium tumefaciens]